MTRARRLREPRYELRLVGGDDADACVVWSRHRLRRLAELSLKLEEAHLRIAPARLVVVDRRAERAAARRQFPAPGAGRAPLGHGQGGGADPKG